MLSEDDPFVGIGIGSLLSLFDDYDIDENDDDADADDDDDVLASSGRGGVNDSVSASANVDSIGGRRVDVDENDLVAVAARISQCPGGGVGGVATKKAIAEEMKHKLWLISRHMGSATQCRGRNGDVLREAGFIEALLSVLDGLLGEGEDDDDDDDDDEDDEEDTINGMEESVDADADSGKTGRGWGDTVGVRLPPLLLLPPPSRHPSKQEEADGEEGNVPDSTPNPIEELSIDLAIACLGSMRDLCCGNAANRAAVHGPVLPGEKGGRRRATGVRILVRYMERYRDVTYDAILNQRFEHDDDNDDGRRGRKEMRLLTNVLGFVRNATHSTARTCEELHKLGATDMLIWRLKHGERGTAVRDDEGTNASAFKASSSSSSACLLPDASKPWREACYRAAGSLINMSEKSKDCASTCGSDLDLVWLLVEAWGGTGKIQDGPSSSSSSSSSSTTKTRCPASTPPLHLGLAAVLHSAENTMENRSNKSMDESLLSILEKDNARRVAAQEREKKRKEQRLCTPLFC